MLQKAHFSLENQMEKQTASTHARTCLWKESIQQEVSQENLNDSNDLLS